MLFTAKEIETMLNNIEIVKEDCKVCIYRGVVLYYPLEHNEEWLSLVDAEEENNDL